MDAFVYSLVGLLCVGVAGWGAVSGGSIMARASKQHRLGLIGGCGLRGGRVRVLIAGVVVAACSLVAPGVASAQPFGGDMGRMFEPALTTRQMERYASMLGLDADQREVLMVLHGAYLEDLSGRLGETRSRIDRMREEARQARDPEMWRRMGEEMESLRVLQQDTERAFMNDVKLMLTSEQLGEWPRLERARRRETTIGLGMMTGERVDVVTLVNELELPEEKLGALRPVLDRYEQELDSALVRRNEFYDRGREMMRGGGMMRGGMDPAQMAEMEKLFNDGREASKRVRDTSARFGRQIESLLDGEYRERFSENFRRSAHPLAYRATRADRAVEVVGSMDDLDASQRSAVQAIIDQHTRQISTANQELARAIEQSEDSMTIRDMFGGGGGMRNAAVREKTERKRELSDGTINRLRGVLTPEQQSRLDESLGRGGDGGEADGARGRLRELREGGGAGAGGEGRARPGRGGAGAGGGGGRDGGERPGRGGERRGID
jgi:hypothetical protein